MKKLACLFAAAVLLAGCGGGSGDDANKDNNTTTSTVTGEGTATNESNGETLKTTAKVTMDGDKFTNVEIDETYKDKDGNDTTKKALGADYGMKETSASIGQIEGGAEWFEQIEFLENYIKENGVDGIELNDEGKATNEDVLTGCTINIKPYIEAVKAAKDNAK